MRFIFNGTLGEHVYGKCVRNVLGGKTEGFLEQGIQGYREREEQAF